MAGCATGPGAGCTGVRLALAAGGCITWMAGSVEGGGITPIVTRAGVDVVPVHGAKRPTVNASQH